MNDRMLARSRVRKDTLYHDCPSCGRAHTQSEAMFGSLQSGTPYVCHNCGARLRRIENRKVTTVLGAVGEHECDDRCLRAKSDDCLCACGGKNHGSKR